MALPSLAYLIPVLVLAAPAVRPSTAERLLEQGKHREALAAVQAERAKVARRRNLRSLEEDRELAHREAMCRERLGQYRPALALERSCLAMALAGRDRTAVKRSLASLADIQSYQGRYLDALATLGHLLGEPACTSPPRDAGEARARLSLATVLGALGQFAQQKQVLDAVVAYFERAADPTGLVRAWSVLASFHQSTGRFEDGLGVADRALARAKDHERADVVPLLVIRSGLLASLGRYEEALAGDRRAMELARAAGLPKLVAACAGSAGASLFYLGDVRGAEGAFHEALEMNRGIGADDEIAHQLYNLGRIAMAQLDDARARELFDGALALQEVTGQDVARALSLSALGEIATGQGRHGEALELHRRALALYDGLGERTGIALENAFLAIDHAELGQLAEALAAAERAGGVDDPEVQWRAALARGLVHRRAGRLADAIADLERARDVLESARAGVRARELRTTFASLEERARVYEALFRAKLEAGDEDGAFRVAEGYRARALKELLAGRGAAIDPAPGLRDVQRALPPGSRLIAYFGMRDELAAFVIERARTRVVRMPVPDARLRDLVAALRLDIAQQADVRASARQLHREVLEPLKLSGDARTFLVPSGILHYVPFAALLDARGRYLIDAHAISYLPAASMVAGGAASRPSPPPGLLVMANPELAEPGRALPFAEEEGRALGAAPGSRVYTGKDATARRLLDEARGAGRIHLACHAELDAFRPLESALLLADGRVRVGDLLAVALSAELVTLSACQTGIGQLLRGDEVVGLARAFLGAGAGAVMASLWSVSDASTRDLMVAFYRALERQPPDRALRDAQRKMIRSKTWAHPFHWAAFAVTGAASWKAR